MRLFRGRRRHGVERKESHTVSLAPEVAARLAAVGRDVHTGKPNLSAGIAIAEHVTRDMDFDARLHHVVKRLPTALQADGKYRGWIVFELVDGPVDPLPPGTNLDIREAL